MSKSHSTVSRRTFMKGLGLGAAGLGAAVATAPVFHDLDEVMQVGKSSMMVHPWYVKEVPKPTVEIDLNLRTQFGTNGETNIVGGMLGGNADYNSSPQLVADWNAQWKINLERDILKDGTPGNTCPGSDRRDITLHRAGLGAYTLTRPAGGFRYKTPDQIVAGLGKWNGTPEDNALMMRTVCQFFGYSWVGYVEPSNASASRYFSIVG